MRHLVKTAAILACLLLLAAGRTSAALQVAGYDAAANERLSLKRAAAVSNLLRQSGHIQPGRVLSPSAMGEGTVAPGETAPASNDEARRVVVRVVTPKSQLTQ